MDRGMQEAMQTEVKVHCLGHQLHNPKVVGVTF